MQCRVGRVASGYYYYFAFSLLPNRINGVPLNVFVSLFLLQPTATVLLFF